MAMTSMRKLFISVSVLLSLLTSVIDAAISCESDSDCALLNDRGDSKCEEGICSNPFRKGCLHAYSKDAPMRVCNSDDKEEDRNVICTPAKFEQYYPELRIHHGDWESSIFMAWIHQIMLMEVMETPVTVGYSSLDTHLASFYSAENSFHLSERSYDMDALVKANEVDDCRNTNESCFHLMPEVWSGADTFDYKDEIEEVESNGLLGQLGLYIPAQLAASYPALGIFYGYQGEKNRQLLAETFLRPTTWLDYCQEVSANNCSSEDTVAARYPNPDEEDTYFVEDEYIGHFRATDKNNCTLNPTTCTGHLVGYPCHWSLHLDPVLYHNDIVGLEQDGPLEPNGGYTPASVIQIWSAAVATNSNVIAAWFYPDSSIVRYIGTPYEFTRVSLPVPTQECLRSRRMDKNSCSADIELRRETNVSACDGEVEKLEKVIAYSVVESTRDANAAEVSPALEFIRSFLVSYYQMNEVFIDWLSRGKDKFGTDAREALCANIVENLDYFRSFTPEFYPKITEFKSNYKTWYTYSAMAFATFVFLMNFICIILVHQFRDRKAIFIAQPFFLQLLLTGLLSYSAGALLTAVEPSDPICVAREWCIVTGTTVELWPLLVKTATINQMLQNTKRTQKVANINRTMMMVQVTVVVSIVVIFLTCWTLLDRPERKEVLVLDLSNDAIVFIDVKCASKSVLWRVVAASWEVTMLLLTAFLAFQSRNQMKQLNESSSLATMVYFHFLCVIIRGVLTVFYAYDSIPASIGTALFSFNYTFNAFMAMNIYVIPKMIEAYKSPQSLRSSRFGTSVRSQLKSTSSNMAIDDTSADLQILTCTANIGNAEPTPESMEGWIPVGGACERVTAFDGLPLPKGNFDIVVIGMQEATWKPKTHKRKSLNADEDGSEEFGESERPLRSDRESKTTERERESHKDLTKDGELNEDLVFAALEERETTVLRDMIQDILGDAYTPMVEELRGQMRLQVWVSSRVLGEISNIQVSGANTGIGNVLANKGGIVVTLRYRLTTISFASAHLAAHEGESYYKARCDNVRSILREATTSELSSRLDFATASHHVFFMGDLNFRTKFEGEAEHEENVTRALEMLLNEDFEQLYSYDELHKGIENGDLLVGFKTLPCSFPPTFKVERKAGFMYKKQRTPSYTDRILFKSSAGLDNNLFCLAYEPCVDFITSDHKPIRGAFSLAPNASMGTISPGDDIRIHITDMECSNLPAADASGKSDPYLEFMWEGVDLVSHKKDFFDTLRKIFSFETNWPKTKYISQTLDPVWKGEEIVLVGKECTFGADAMLFVVVTDFDAIGTNDFLCATQLNLKDLIGGQFGDSRKQQEFELPLLGEGKHAGTIRFKVQIQSASKKSSRYGLF